MLTPDDTLLKKRPGSGNQTRFVSRGIENVLNVDNRRTQGIFIGGGKKARQSAGIASREVMCRHS